MPSKRFCDCVTCLNLSIGRECDRVDLDVVSYTNRIQIARLGIPYSNLVVAGARDDMLPIW